METILIGIAFVTGIVGIFWRDPSRPVQIFLVALLVAASGASLWKSFTDEQDKELLQTLAVAGLALPNSAYDKVYEQLDAAFENAPSKCLHSTEGMTCVQNGTDKIPSRTLVFNRYEVARVYADAVRGKKTKGFLVSILQKRYNPKDLRDDYEEKLAILGYYVYYDMCGKYPSDYNYDDEHGIRIWYHDSGGRQQAIQISFKEMIEPETDSGPVLFQHFDKMYRDRISAALPDCKYDESNRR